VLHSQLITWISRSAPWCPVCGIGCELIISRRPARLLGFGCADERPEKMEWWSHINLSRREIYHVCCERGMLAPTYGADIVVSRLFSCGCVRMERWTSSEETSRPTRYVLEACSQSMSPHPTDKPRTPTELDRKQYQSETVNLPWQYSNIITLPRVIRPDARTGCELRPPSQRPPLHRKHLAQPSVPQGLLL